MNANNNAKLIAGALIGNIMEFFDFISYAYLSSYITKKFFSFHSLNKISGATTL